MVLTPVLVLVLLVTVQLAAYFHAANVAAAAASRGAAAASPIARGGDDASAAATRTVAELHARLAVAPDVVISAARVRVEVTIAVPGIVPLFPQTVSRAAIEPRERAIPEPER